jgi:hypothetical protein
MNQALAPRVELYNQHLLRKERVQIEDQLAKARLKIEQQANRIDELEAKLALLREAKCDT